MQKLDDKRISRLAIEMYLDHDDVFKKSSYDIKKTTTYSLLTYNAACLMATTVTENNNVRVFIPNFNPHRLFKFMRDDLRMGSFNRSSKTNLTSTLLNGIKKLVEAGHDKTYICNELSISKATFKKYKTQLTEDPKKQGFNSPQSIYNALEVLKSQGLIEIYDHPEYGPICELVFEHTGYLSQSGDYDDGLRKGHVSFNAFLLSEDFFNMELRDQKAAMYFLYRLYDDHDESSQISLLPRSKRRTPQIEYKPYDYEVLERILKVNRRAHIKKIMDKLKKFFNFKERTDTRTPLTFRFMLNKQFRSIKNKKAPTVTPTINQTDIQTIHRELHYHNLKLPDEDVHKMAAALSVFKNKRVRVHSIQEFVKQLKNGYKASNPAGLLHSIATKRKQLQVT